MSKINLKVKNYFIIPALLIIAVAGISPFFEAFTTSFFHDTYGSRVFCGLDNFRFLRGDAGFSYSLNITALWAVISTVLSLFTGFITALLLSNKKRLSSIIYAALLVPWGIPVYIAVPLWRALIHGNGGISILTAVFGIKANLMLNPAAGFTASMIVNIWITVPLTAFVLHGAIKKIPKSCIEAAVIDGAGKGLIAAKIYLPQIKPTLTVMAILNFIKAFKEFTLLFLMTAGGPPLISGITERFVIGATTTMDIFLYDIFNNLEDYGISSAYSVIMAAIVIMLMLIWFVSKNKSFSAVKRYRLLVLIAAAIQILFEGRSGVIPALLYLAAVKNRRFFKAAVAVHAGWIIYGLITAGFLEGFSPGIFPAVFVLIFTINMKNLPGEKRPLLLKPRLFDGLNIGLQTASGIFLIFSAAALLYLLIWMSFSGVSACYIDSPLPPHAGISGYSSVIFDENIFLYFKNTIFIAALTGIAVPIVCFPAAIWLNSRGKGITIAALTIIQILSITGGMHSLIPLYASFRRAGLVNSYLPIVIISVYHSIPFAMFTITAWLERMPGSFKDIALLEGQPSISYMTKIILPLSGPVLITAVMTAVLGAWNSFMAPLLFLNDDQMFTISVKLYSFVGSIASGAPEWNIFAAASVINCIIIALLFSRFRKPVGETGISDFTD